jgi:hypothetical protein
VRAPLLEPFVERELHEPVDECLPDGRLNPAAVGWSRRPLHRCNLRGAPLRTKRWDYWCVTTDTHLLSMTFTNLGHVGLANAWFLEYAGSRIVERQVLVPFARGFAQPETVAGDDIHFESGRLRIDIVEDAKATQLHVAFPSARGRVEAELRVEAPPGHESLNVLVPWSSRRFQFTSKHNTRPASGVVRVGADEHAFGPANQAFGCLDFGRGIWPWRSAWNWASASGVQAGRTLGLNLGGKWTDGTRSTENGLCIDGRLHKLSEDLVWEYDRARWRQPWRIRARSGRVDLEFTPFFHKRGRLELGLLASHLNVLFGRFSGTVIGDDGSAYPVRDLVGWAEEHLARW